MCRTGPKKKKLQSLLTKRQRHLANICKAITALEAKATREAEEKAAEANRKIEERRRYQAETGVKPKGPDPVVPDVSKAVPGPKSQSENFVDGESRIMMDGATKGFVQGYNTQNAVDSVCQIVVATSVTQEVNDKQQLVPMTLAVEETTGQLPEKASADSGYCSAANLTDARLRDVDFYIAVARQRHHSDENERSAAAEHSREAVPAETGPVAMPIEKAQSAKPAAPPQNTNGGGPSVVSSAAIVCCALLSTYHPLVFILRTAMLIGDLKFLTPVQLMELKLSTPQGKAEYAKRKCVVEPVHGQVKEVQRARRFQFRGLKKVNCEWRLIMMGHNILKLFRHARNKVLEIIRTQARSLCYSG